MPVLAASPLALALERIGDRWTLQVVAALLDGPRRFGDLQESLDGIAPNVLSARLRALERDAIIVAQPYSTRPPRMVYELTEAGRGLAGALRLLADWGARQSEAVEAPRHAVCGTELRTVWWCETCGTPVEADSATDDLHEV
jgi:DNA-binding HxlR family transcriptional regulator